MPQLNTNSFPHQLNNAFFWLLVLYMLISLSIAPKIFSIISVRVMLIAKEKFDGWKNFFKSLKNSAYQKNLQKMTVDSFEKNCFEKIALLSESDEVETTLESASYLIEEKLKNEELDLKIASLLGDTLFKVKN